MTSRSIMASFSLPGVPARYVTPIATLCLCLVSFSAQAALFDDDEARRAILELRQKMDAAQLRGADEIRRSSDENSQLRRSLLELSNQIEAVRNESAAIRGQNEKLARDIADIQRVQKDTAQGVDERMRKFEPTKVTVDGREFVAEPAERQDFDAALAALRKSDFAGAQAGFVGLVKQYPQTGYRSSALFWLGNAQYASRNCKEAITNFRSLVTADPQHLRAPEALLSIANCQGELKDTKTARRTLEELLKSYPQSEAAGVAKERISKAN